MVIKYGKFCFIYMVNIKNITHINKRYRNFYV